MAETFVLVHGAWHGAWCWAAVINQLEKLGDRAYAVDLPGHGMNQADRSKVTLESYVDSVAEFIERHNLRNVVLAGHSLGGLTIPGVAAKIPSRIKRVVWVTAIVALDGQPIVDPATSPLAAACGFAAGAIDSDRDDGQGICRRAHQRHGARVEGIRAVGAGSAADRADDRAGGDGALLRHRNSEQLYRLRGRSDAGGGRAELASAFFEPAEESHVQVREERARGHVYASGGMRSGAA